LPELDVDVGTGTEGDVEARCFSKSPLVTATRADWARKGFSARRTDRHFLRPDRDWHAALRSRAKQIPEGNRGAWATNGSAPVDPGMFGMAWSGSCDADKQALLPEQLHPLSENLISKVGRARGRTQHFDGREMEDTGRSGIYAPVS
jgi:hypothetical protein